MARRKPIIKKAAVTSRTSQVLARRTSLSKLRTASNKTSNSRSTSTSKELISSRKKSLSRRQTSRPPLFSTVARQLETARQAFNFSVITWQDRSSAQLQKFSRRSRRNWRKTVTATQAQWHNFSDQTQASWQDLTTQTHASWQKVSDQTQTTWNQGRQQVKQATLALATKRHELRQRLKASQKAKKKQSRAQKATSRPVATQPKLGHRAARQITPVALPNLKVPSLTKVRLPILLWPEFKLPSLAMFNRTPTLFVTPPTNSIPSVTPSPKKLKKQGTISIKAKRGVIFSAQPLPVWQAWGLRLSQTLGSLDKAFRQGSQELLKELQEMFGVVPPTQSSQKITPKPVATPQIKRRTSRQPWLRQLSKWSQKRQTAFQRTLQRFGKGLQHLGAAIVHPFAIVLRRYPWQLTLLVVILSSALGTGYFVYVYVFKDLPSVYLLTQEQPPVTTKILDRNGTTLFGIYKDENRTVVPLSSLPTHLLAATVAIEDKEFYQHQGFSVRGIIRAALANAKGEIVQGGSTITQQLVKNRLLSPEQTLQRKLKEIVLAIQVDSTFTKQEILEMYLNEVAYGGSTYGIEEAAQQYFGKSAKDISLAESALLAGLPAAPSAYSPFGPAPELAYARQEEVLRRMVEDAYITPEQAEAAKQEVLQFRANRVNIKAPHFVMYVKKLLAEQFGEAVVSEGGLEVTTTLDLALHDQTQKIVTDEITKLKRLRISNGAALVTNPKTGEVLSMVGSTDYFDFAHDGQVNVVLRPRQPGSSIKPLTYAVAFERGKSPSTVEDDAPIVYNLPGSKPYAPKNYDGRFHGRVTLREALGSSYNIPAVKLLAWAGLDAIIDKGREMGITTWEDRRRFGLSLTLGGGEVLMYDMAKLYGTFANQGYTTELNPILEVKNYKGEVLYRNECALDNVCPKRKTLDSRVAYYITDILKDNQARTPAFGARSVLTIPGQEVAVKTGTTNNLRDNWTIGYTSDRVVAVWVGNNDSTPMSYVASGVTGASPIWNSIIRLTLNETAPHAFAGPEGMVKVQICARTGTLPCKGCPYIRDEYFVPGTEPKLACSPAQFAPKPKPSPSPGTDQILDGLFSP